MTKFECFDKSIYLPAIALEEKAETIKKSAWLGQHITIKLTESISAIRVHTNGRDFGDEIRPASGEGGRWLLIGDIIFTRSQLADNRSLPVYNRDSMLAFTHTAKAIVYKDSILNIGLASQLYDGRGGEFQAEFVSGPKVEFDTFDGKYWHDQEGHA